MPKTAPGVVASATHETHSIASGPVSGLRRQGKCQGNMARPWRPGHLGMILGIFRACFYPLIPAGLRLSGKKMSLVSANSMSDRSRAGPMVTNIPASALSEGSCRDKAS